MSKKVFYLVLGSKEAMTRPFDRVEDEEQAKKNVKFCREEEGWADAFYLSASEYRELTGRDASRDYQKEIRE